MTRTKATRTRRHPVANKPHALITGAEARGEAAYLVLELVLRELPQGMCKRVMAKSYVAADGLGIASITEEVECLFANIVIETPTR